VIGLRFPFTALQCTAIEVTGKEVDWRWRLSANKLICTRSWEAGLRPKQMMVLGASPGLSAVRRRQNIKEAEIHVSLSKSTQRQSLSSF